MSPSLHWAGHAQLPTALSRPIHSTWYWKRLVSHCLMSWIDRIYYSVFLHWITFAFVSISALCTGLPHSQMNKSLTFWVWHDLPTWVWGAAMEKILSSWFLMGASLEVSSVKPGISGWFEAVVFWNYGKIVLPLLIWLLLPNGPASLH